MARRASKHKSNGGRSWSARMLDRTRSALRQIRVALWVAGSAGLVVGLLASAIGLDRLNARALAARLEEVPEARVEFADLPAPLHRLAAEDDLRQSIAAELTLPWTRDDACRRLAERVRTVGWVEGVNYIRRAPDGRFLIGCDYRVPVAWVRHAGSTYLIDRAGVRLPGVYRNDGFTPQIEHVATPPPRPGEVWPGEDVQAGLTMLRLLTPEPFLDQIAAIDVSNVGGRVAGSASRIELATDQEFGRIRWGSVPGHEVEENAVEQKLALLRANYRETGRVDAHHPVIDVSTFPDRFTVYEP